ncbi:MAG: methyltransferase domain-containing protein [Ginsengibacter sp.]
MIDFATRSYKKEYLDDPEIPFEEIVVNMRELNFINKWLGGHSVSINGFKQLLGKKKQISICEIGCGGGDNLKAIYGFCKKKNLQISLTGIDIKPECIVLAKKNIDVENATFLIADYRKVHFQETPDIIFSSLFCHHFTDEELIEMLQWMQENSVTGFFINDLHRHVLAYNFIKVTTRLFSKSYLVKNDAPLSVLRGFRKKEWQKIFDQAKINNYSIRWRWGFRFLIVSPKYTQH